MLKYSEYVDFFKTACEKHIEILHTPSNKHFERIVLDYDPMMGSSPQIRAFISGKKRELKSPIVLLISYVARYSDERNDAQTKQMAGGIVVLKPSAAGDFDGEEAVFDDCERIAAELMGYTDEKLVLPDRLEWTGVVNERMHDVEGYSGVRFDFTIVVPAYNEIAYKPSQFGE